MERNYIDKQNGGYDSLISAHITKSIEFIYFAKIMIFALNGWINKTKEALKSYKIDCLEKPCFGLDGEQLKFLLTLLYMEKGLIKSSYNTLINLEILFSRHVWSPKENQTICNIFERKNDDQTEELTRKLVLERVLHMVHKIKAHRNELPDTPPLTVIDLQALGTDNIHSLDLLFKFAR